MKHIDMSKLAEELRAYLDLLDEREKLADQIKNFRPEPQKPWIVEKPEDWVVYQTQVSQRNIDAKELDDRATDIKGKIADKESLLRLLLPANTWVKVSLGYNRTVQYVGYQTDDWPGYVPRIELSTEKPTRVLKHRCS